MISNVPIKDVRPGDTVDVIVPRKGKRSALSRLEEPPVEQVVPATVVAVHPHHVALSRKSWVANAKEFFAHRERISNARRIG